MISNILTINIGYDVVKNDYVCVNKVTEQLYTHLCDDIPECINKTNLDKYYINRVLTIHNMFDVDNYYIESYNVYIDPPIGFMDDMSYITTSDRDRIIHLIKKEYGCINPRLCYKDWNVYYVNKKDIIKNYQYSVNDNYDRLEYYSDDNYCNSIPRCILVKEDNRYRIIDGYHRIVNTTKDKVLAIVSE